MREKISDIATVLFFVAVFAVTFSAVSQCIISTHTVLAVLQK